MRRTMMTTGKPSRAPSFSSLIRDVETFTSHSNEALNVMEGK
jgi:hypothetical protein